MEEEGDDDYSQQINARNPNAPSRLLSDVPIDEEGRSENVSVQKRGLQSKFQCVSHCPQAFQDVQEQQAVEQQRKSRYTERIMKDQLSPERVDPFGE